MELTRSNSRPIKITKAKKIMDPFKFIGHEDYYPNLGEG